MFVDGAVTINLAIDIFTEVEIKERQDAKIVVESVDMGILTEATDYNNFIRSKEPKLRLLQSVASEFPSLRDKSFSLRTSSQSPVGGGLGGSSSLCISLLKAFSKFTGSPLPSVIDTVSWAHHIEAKVLGTPTGTQDYFPPISGGLNIIKFTARKIEHKVLPVPEVFKNNFLLIYTGKSHHSGMNNFEVLKSAVLKEERVLSQLLELKVIAEELEHVLDQKKWSLIPELFRREYSTRVKLSPAFSCPEIERINTISEKYFGATKICGAGGGGCVMVWISQKEKDKFVKEITQEGFQILPTQVLGPL